MFLFSMLAFCLAIFGLWADVQLNLEIVWIWIRHGTPNNLNLSATWDALQDQEISWQFADDFWIEDLMWLETWHYTTIQCNWLRNWSWSILTWIYLKAWNSSPIRRFGNTWNVLISNELTSYKSIYNPVVYIYKPTNYINIWKANKYWDIPTIKVAIPANTMPGVYNGTIVFSLYTE